MCALFETTPNTTQATTTHCIQYTRVGWVEVRAEKIVASLHRATAAKMLWFKSELN